MEYDIEIVELDEQPVLVIEAEVAPPDLGAELARILPAVHGYVTENGGQMAGMPFLRYLNMTDRFHIAAGIPTVEPMEGTGEILSKVLPGGKAATTLFLGEYHRVGEAWDALNAWCADQGFDVGFGGWDVYENDPSEITNPNELRTRIYFPLPTR